MKTLLEKIKHFELDAFLSKEEINEIEEALLHKCEECEECEDCDECADCDCDDCDGAHNDGINRKTERSEGLSG